ncbi:penicillin-binding protein, 1A family [Rheinheimera sp. A13L]|uniref:penicillin-binding protein 1A n=1 Tax=Rheinheimera sp. A13L TaxID=506534 RepID=UPI0002124961|nr:PBP1A family penicillin-binding protein [Rheinheimera sp. A13L]EGM76230.1 penicillin-binding protein, 1A family [Rheinheimera sp. A13L]
MSWFKKLIILVIAGVFSVVATVAASYWYVKDDLPSVATLKDVKLQTPMRVFSQDGELISQFGEKRRIPLKLEEMPDLLLKAVLATEDNRFYEHPGIDVIGMFRAFTVVAMSGEARQGASTITQQLARVFFLTREKKLIRKIKEIFLALRIEQELTKDEILELYLNKIELGHRSFGVGAAAQVYFGKNIQDLTLSEMAIIAGLPQGPSVLNPVRSPSRARARRNIVLGRMLNEGYITQAQYDEALQEPILSKLHGAQITASAPYIAEMVRQEVVDKFGEEEAYSKGFQVFTTVDSKLQGKAVAAVQKNVVGYDERHGYRGPVATLWQATAQPQEDGSVKFAETEPMTDEAILAYLDTQHGLEDLVPAVITGVSGQQAEAILSGGRKITLPWQGLNWARAFISHDRQSHPPKAAADVLAPGMHVLVRPDAGEWRLGQIPGVSGAIVAINPKDGAVQALVGGYSFAMTQFNRATQANRQVGSNIKPFIYSAALEEDLTLATLMNDAPIHQWDEGSNQAWRPKNSPEVYDGAIRIREALAKSKNVVAVRLLRAVGIENTRQHLTKFGFREKDLPHSETLALGSASLTPLELATGYAVFANGGFLVKPYVITKILDDQNNLIYEHIPVPVCAECEQQDLAAKAAAEQAAKEAAALAENADPEALLEATFAEQTTATEATAAEQPEVKVPAYAPRVLSAQNAFLIADALKSSIWGGGDWKAGTGWLGTAHRLRELKRQDLAGKTGTTNDVKDAWFSGFSPELVVTSWVGFDDAESRLGKTAWNNNLGKDQIAGGESGAKTALPAWQEFVGFALKDKPQVYIQPPVGITSVRIDLKTGLLTQATDNSSGFEFFKQGTEPKTYVNSSVQQLPTQNNQQQQDEIELF